MMIYRLDYWPVAETYDVLADWPKVMHVCGLDESFQYTLAEKTRYVKDYWLATSKGKSEWFCSRREAVVRRLELFKAGKLHGRKNDHPIAMVDMPTRKREIVTWLNERKIK